MKLKTLVFLNNIVVASNTFSVISISVDKYKLQKPNTIVKLNSVTTTNALSLTKDPNLPTENLSDFTIFFEDPE